MKLFKCTHCGQLLFFENGFCERCKYPLGFVSQQLQLLPLEVAGPDTFRIYNQGPFLYRYCANHQYGVCNWLVADGSQTPYCKACTLNRTIPNLSKAEYLQRWRVIEVAKHRLVYTLRRMKLPLVSKTTDPDKGLSFDFLADENPGHSPRILTGHSRGLITINIAEADDIEREMARRAMDEPYRTVLGHFRHEVGHYYWDQLIDHSDHLTACRELFGDERQNYAEALKQHYRKGPARGWNQHFISAYASAHPWEDWAETWAHYMHILDTLETAYDFGLSVHPRIIEERTILSSEVKIDPYDPENFEMLISLWLPLCFAMNSLNRSMGHSDLYPFVIPPLVMQKLSFIHRVCYEARVV
ncbi:zinc-binding metallopeptidase family protein [Tellurirhabdus bombi]|uniref:zinc-binding metallopeptidase family protein n=1 Tax=Tellurirhabdus bombi TaxID=2907205 RepID=UPI001F22786F|nr:putative zinc-binding peptidase [Tellurirhabdus bombi]